MSFAGGVAEISNLCPPVAEPMIRADGDDVDSALMVDFF